MSKANRKAAQQVREAPAEKALGLTVRYARLCARVDQCRHTAAQLYSSCEKPIVNDDYPGVGMGSSCLRTLSELLVENRSNSNRSYGEDSLSFDEVVDEAEMCRHCKVGLNLRMHVKHKLGKRRSAVLAAICRLGNKQVRK